MYLDNASTTPLLPEVKKEIIRWLDEFGNPSSAHQEGRIVKTKIEDVRVKVAQFIGGNTDNVIFTSSGSASNSLVINGLDDSYLFLYTPTCHKSMRLACEYKPCHCAVEMTNNGLIDYEWLKNYIKNIWYRKIVFCYEMVNSEIGVCQNNEEIKRIIKGKNGIIVADATAYVPHYSLHANYEGADFYTFSAHKIGALKGVGVVYYNSMENIKPLVYGSQERGLFGGTENVIGIISLGKATEYWYKYSRQCKILAHYLSDEIITQIPDSYEITSDFDDKVSNIMMFCFKGVRGEELLELLNEDGYFVSTGSACNSGSLELSPTLLSIRMPESDIPCCLRISLCGSEDVTEIKEFINSLKKNVNKLRTFGDAYEKEI